MCQQTPRAFCGGSWCLLQLRWKLISFVWCTRTRHCVETWTKTTIIFCINATQKYSIKTWQSKRPLGILTQAKVMRYESDLKFSTKVKFKASHLFAEVGTFNWQSAFINLCTNFRWSYLYLHSLYLQHFLYIVHILYFYNLAEHFCSFWFMFWSKSWEPLSLSTSGKMGNLWNIQLRNERLKWYIGYLLNK